MKKIAFLSIILTLFLASCSSDETSSSTASSELQQSIKSYVSDNYPDATVDAITLSGSTATATLSTGEQVVFNSNGTFMSYENNISAGLKTDSLITSADSTCTDSVSGNHHRHHHSDKGNGHKHSGYKQHDSDVAVDSLPTIINDYLSTNYAGYTVTYAKNDTICEGAVITVMVCDSASEPVKVIFDTAGNFLMSGIRMNYSDVPEVISTAISTNYSTYTVANRCSIYTLADSSVQYKVYLKLDKKPDWVRISSDGSVVCENL